MEKIKAPFTKEQVEALNNFQKDGRFHPFTCGSPEDIAECLVAKNDVEILAIGLNEGILIASEDGWICPCGQYKQDWAYKFMAEKQK